MLSWFNKLNVTNKEQSKHLNKKPIKSILKMAPPTFVTLTLKDSAVNSAPIDIKSLYDTHKDKVKDALTDKAGAFILMGKQTKEEAKQAAAGKEGVKFYGLNIRILKKDERNNYPTELTWGRVSGIMGYMMYKQFPNATTTALASSIKYGGNLEAVKKAKIFCMPGAAYGAKLFYENDFKLEDAVSQATFGAICGWILCLEYKAYLHDTPRGVRFQEYVTRLSNFVKEQGGLALLTRQIPDWGTIVKTNVNSKAAYADLLKNVTFVNGAITDRIMAQINGLNDNIFD